MHSKKQMCNRLALLWQTSAVTKADIFHILPKNIYEFKNKNISHRDDHKVLSDFSSDVLPV